MREPGARMPVHHQEEHADPGPGHVSLDQHPPVVRQASGRARRARRRRSSTRRTRLGAPARPWTASALSQSGAPSRAELLRGRHLVLRRRARAGGAGSPSSAATRSALLKASSTSDWIEERKQVLELVERRPEAEEEGLGRDDGPDAERAHRLPDPGEELRRGRRRVDARAADVARVEARARGRTPRRRAPDSRRRPSDRMTPTAPSEPAWGTRTGTLPRSTPPGSPLRTTALHRPDQRLDRLVDARRSRCRSTRPTGRTDPRAPGAECCTTGRAG